MKEEKDILDIFENSFESGTPITGGDWQNISLKNASRQFWRWNPLNMNAYYVGLILVSFVGTFVLGTDYYITKEKITYGYEARITELENRLNELEIQNNKSSENPDLGRSTTEKEEVKLENNANAYQGLSQPSSNPKTKGELDEPTQVDYEPINEVKHVSSQSEETEPLQVEAVEITKKPSEQDVSTDSPINSEKIFVINSEGSRNDEGIVEIEDAIENRVVEKEPSKPVIKYVQDTIYEVDSSKVSRWKMKKMK